MTEANTGQWRERSAIAAVLLIAAGLRLWRLEDNGFGTAYYAAGVRSMTQGAWLFFYNAFDPAGFISLDKPPVAFWIQTLFAWLLGYDGWTIHLPQALAGWPRWRCSTGWCVARSACQPASAPPCCWR